MKGGTRGQDRFSLLSFACRLPRAQKFSCILVNFARSIKVGFHALSRNVFVHMHVNKIEAMCKVSRVNAKESGESVTIDNKVTIVKHDKRTPSPPPFFSPLTSLPYCP